MEGTRHRKRNSSLFGSRSKKNIDSSPSPDPSASSAAPPQEQLSDDSKRRILQDKVRSQTDYVEMLKKSLAKEEEKLAKLTEELKKFDAMRSIGCNLDNVYFGPIAEQTGASAPVDSTYNPVVSDISKPKKKISSDDDVLGSLASASASGGVGQKDNKSGRSLFSLRSLGHRRSKSLSRTAGATPQGVDLGPVSVKKTLAQTLSEEGSAVPRIVRECCEFLEAEDRLKTEGLFRHSPNAAELQTVYMRCVESAVAEHVAAQTACKKDIHVAGSLLKKFLNERLSDAIVTEDAFAAFKTLAKKHNSGADALSSELPTVKKIIDDILPPANRLTLQYLVGFFVKVAAESDSNKMHSHNLGTVFAPGLFHIRMDAGSASLSENEFASDIVALLIDNYNPIFAVAPEGRGKGRKTGRYKHKAKKSAAPPSESAGTDLGNSRRTGLGGSRRSGFGRSGRNGFGRSGRRPPPIPKSPVPSHVPAPDGSIESSSSHIPEDQHPLSSSKRQLSIRRPQRALDGSGRVVGYIDISVATGSGFGGADSSAGVLSSRKLGSEDMSDMCSAGGTELSSRISDSERTDKI